MLGLQSIRKLKDRGSGKDDASVQARELRFLRSLQTTHIPNLTLVIRHAR